MRTFKNTAIAKSLGAVLWSHPSSFGATLLQGPSEESAVNGWKRKGWEGMGDNTIWRIRIRHRLGRFYALRGVQICLGQLLHLLPEESAWRLSMHVNSMICPFESIRRMGILSFVLTHATRSYGTTNKKKRNRRLENWAAGSAVSFHSQEWSISIFPCSLTINITSYSMENVAFHSLQRWKMIILLIPTVSLIHFFGSKV